MIGVLPLQGLIDRAGRQLTDLMANLFDLREGDLLRNSFLAKLLLRNQLCQFLQLPPHGWRPTLVC